MAFVSGTPVPSSSVWRSHPRTVVGLSLLLVGSLILPPLYEVHPIVRTLDYLCALVLGFWSAGLAWRRTRRQGPAAAFSFIGLGAALGGLHYVPGLLRVPQATISGRAISILGLLTLGIGFLLWPQQSRLRRERLRTVLDGVAIALAAFTAAWMAVGTLDGVGRLTRAAMLMEVAQVSAALGLIAFWLLQETRLMLPEQSAAKRHVRNALLILLGHSLLSGLLRATGHYQGFVAHGSEILHQGAIFLLALAALSPSSPAAAPSPRAAVSPLRALLPSLVSLAVLLLAAFRILRPHGEPERTLMALGMALLSILMVRHGLLILDLERLSLDLEARVAERTEKLEAHHREAMSDLKMRIVAGLAAGLAHDLNNILGIIRLRVDLLAEGCLPAQQEHLKVLGEASDRAITMTRRILTSSRMQDVTPSPFDLSGWVRDRGPLLRALMRSQQRLDFDVAPDLHVFMDPQSLDQIIQNLVTNARDAMGPDGVLQVRAAERAGAIQIEIRDNGPGIPAEHLPRLFDPFFTTKPHGTGLGLPTVRNLVLQNRGAIQVESEVGRGTVFYLDLPVPERLL